MLCPLSTDQMGFSLLTDLTEEMAPTGMGYAADLGIPSPRVELLPFKGPKDMVFLGHFFAKGSVGG